MASPCEFELKPKEALKRLKDGNRAYLQGKPPNADDDDKQRRHDQRCGQKPFAVIVSCSDSRVPPERVFGYGLGDLFVIRTAGHVVDMPALGSIQYAVANLCVPLIVVMGHEQCGAVVAAIEAVRKKKSFPGAIPFLIESIKPAVLRVCAHHKPGHEWTASDTDEVVRENSRQVAATLKGISDGVISSYIDSGKVEVVGARYDLDTGKVEFFEDAKPAASKVKVAQAKSAKA